MPRPSTEGARRPPPLDQLSRRAIRRGCRYRSGPLGARRRSRGRRRRCTPAVPHSRSCTEADGSSLVGDVPSGWSTCTRSPLRTPRDTPGEQRIERDPGAPPVPVLRDRSAPRRRLACGEAIDVPWTSTGAGVVEPLQSWNHDGVFGVPSGLRSPAARPRSWGMRRGSGSEPRRRVRASTCHGTSRPELRRRSRRNRSWSSRPWSCSADGRDADHVVALGRHIEARVVHRAVVLVAGREIRALSSNGG